MKKIILFLSLMLVLSAGSVFAAGTKTIISGKKEYRIGQTVKRLKHFLGKPNAVKTTYKKHGISKILTYQKASEKDYTISKFYFFELENTHFYLYKIVVNQELIH